MDVSLDEKAKAGFFDQLAALNHESDVEEDDLKHEQELRRAGRKYFAKTKTRSSRSSTPVAPAAESRVPVPKKSPIRAAKRTASAPTPITAIAAASRMVIENTPDVGTKARKPQAASTSFIEDTPLAELAPKPNLRLRRSSTNPLRDTTLSRTLVDQSPSLTSSIMGKSKRKRNSTETAPQIPDSEQVLRGLSFFYIPDNDVNKVRRDRIIRARAYGAEWTRQIASATHVIVDKHLRYKDIESIVDPVAGKTSVSVVNEDYPLDCIKFRFVVPADQLRFRVQGAPAAQQPPVLNTPVESEVSQKSLELKAPRNSRALIQSTPSQSEASSL